MGGSTVSVKEKTVLGAVGIGLVVLFLLAADDAWSGLEPSAFALAAMWGVAAVVCFGVATQRLQKKNLWAVGGLGLLVVVAAYCLADLLLGFRLSAAMVLVAVLGLGAYLWRKAMKVKRGARGTAIALFGIFIVAMIPGGSAAEFTADTATDSSGYGHDLVFTDDDSAPSTSTTSTAAALAGHEKFGVGMKQTLGDVNAGWPLQGATKWVKDQPSDLPNDYDASVFLAWKEPAEGGGLIHFDYEIGCSGENGPLNGYNIAVAMLVIDNAGPEPALLFNAEVGVANPGPDYPQFDIVANGVSNNWQDQIPESAPGSFHTVWMTKNGRDVNVKYDGAAIAWPGYANEVLADTGSGRDCSDHSPYHFVRGNLFMTFDDAYTEDVGTLYEARVWDEALSNATMDALASGASGQYKNHLVGGEVAAWLFGDSLASSGHAQSTNHSGRQGVRDAETKPSLVPKELRAVGQAYRSAAGPAKDVVENVLGGALNQIDQWLGQK